MWSSLQPPSPDWSNALDWVLRRGFCPQVEVMDAPEGALALRLSRSFEVSGRIAQNLGPEGCRRELGDAAGTALHEDLLTNVAVTAALQEATKRVAQTAQRHGVELILLKFAALNARGLLRPGTRSAGDVDVLVPLEQAEGLWRALQSDAGFARFGARAYDHQLEPLASTVGSVVEVHTKLPGVVGASGRYARFDDVSSQADVVAGGDSVDRVRAPSLDVMAAQALAHGLLQNLGAPQSYSPFRMLGDLIDLRRADHTILTRAGRLLDERLGLGVAEEAETLCELLSSGCWSRNQLEELKLFRHCLAARLNPTYAGTLRRRGWFVMLSEEPPLLAWANKVRWLVFPSRAELDSIYGSSQDPWARLEARLRRPIDVVARILGPSGRGT